ncbi:MULTISPECIES: hypothetical protein [unclassified Sphingopyxis]|jgi:hypothetical protein|uniref:hypothetical protein n=1 Tax=unclassified Sphingopyxis TaxID=2614943 RepID=UPI002860544A|nr:MULTISPECIES: hypothetical protein [unclassified Sphingopyxis]MDR6832901.1 hypothetical protein [Sphingopyxis sp. BE122]MDR7228644.1 hypothetical protein [Sphingopyxis sp. BE259]
MTTQASKAAGWRKMAIQAVFGAIAGAGGMFAMLALIDAQGGLDWAPSAIILLGVGFIYALMGAFVGVGTVAPRLVGQRLLNVADAEEIVEERANMSFSAIGCIGLGAALMLLAQAVSAEAAGTAALVSPAAAFWILLAILGGFTLLSLWMWKSFDELWRQLTVEITAMTGNFLMIVAIVWGGAAAAELVAGPQPLDLVSLSLGSMLLACFVVTARRGMMAPR